MSFRIDNQLVAELLGRMEFIGARHDVLSGNIAHSETPNYVAKDVLFKGFVEQNMGDTNGVGGKPEMEIIESQSPKNANGNNVSLENEMAKMTDNSLEYMTAAEIMKKHLSLLKYSTQV